MNKNTEFFLPSDNKARALSFIFIIFLVFVVSLVVLSSKLRKEITDIERDKAAIPVYVVKSKKKALSGQRSQSVTRKTIIVRGNDFVEHWFYSGDEALAKQRVNHEGIMDTEGEIPDGKIRFVDTYKKTYGVEYYENGVREGLSETYYESGELKERAFYQRGKVATKTEYYTDGSKRFELNTTDARNLGDDSEVGIGKLYWPNGNLKYEWFLTRREPVGYKKSYNRDGDLRHAVYYDEFNNEIRR